MKNVIRSSVNFLGKSIFLSFVVCAFSLSGFLSCASLPDTVIQKAFPRVDSKPPIDAFGLVMTESTIKPGECVKNENYEDCLEVIDKLPIITRHGVGSGLLVQARTKVVFLTAAHVCQDKGLKFHESHGIKISLKIETSLKIRNSTGEILPAKILKIDEENDLCALSPSRVFTEPVRWSAKPPEVGDIAYAISAPHGINSPDMNLIFRGYYSGAIGSIHHYTIPTRPGSSGSIDLDKNFRGIGMLNAAYLKMESIGIGTGYREIRHFLNSI